MYLDYAATCPVSKVWIDSINESYNNLYGNPGSNHIKGFEAKKSIEDSIYNIKSFVFDRNPEKWNVCFNSGSTESINQFINVCNNKDTLFIYENTAHKAVLESIKKYTSNSYCLDMSLTINENIEKLSKYIEDNRFKSCILILTSVNNETGDIYSEDLIKKVKDLFTESLVFLDHTQGFMKESINEDLVDAFCFSVHKIGGFKRFGGLFYKNYLSDKLKENPLIVGGYDIRAGTEDPLNIKALSELIEYKFIKSYSTKKKVKALHDLIIDKLNNIAQECRVELQFNHSSKNKQSDYIINGSFIGIEGESLMSCLEEDCISTGSACNSSELKTSHVLLGLGISKLRANCAFRISLSDEIDEQELIEFLDTRFKNAIKFLSRMRIRNQEDMQ